MPVALIPVGLSSRNIGIASRSGGEEISRDLWRKKETKAQGRLQLTID
jgi:hypothetical protein